MSFWVSQAWSAYTIVLESHLESRWKVMTSNSVNKSKTDLVSECVNTWIQSDNSLVYLWVFLAEGTKKSYIHESYYTAHDARLFVIACFILSSCGV